MLQAPISKKTFRFYKKHLPNEMNTSVFMDVYGIPYILSVEYMSNICLQTLVGSGRLQERQTARRC